jgi:hypothetical protein
MYVKFVSDLDYMFNQATGQWDVPAVEWETPYGRFRERFESEEERSKALTENQAYNETPEVKAYIQEMDEAEDKWRAEVYTAELFDHALENNQTVSLSGAIRFAECYSARMQKLIAALVCTHNKLMLKAKRVPSPAMNTIADFM